MSRPQPELTDRFDLACGMIVLLSLSAALAYPLSLSIVPHVAGIAGYVMLALRQRSLPRPDRGIAILFAAIAALALLSAIWSIAPDKSWSRAVKAASLLLLFLPFLTFLAQMPERGVAFARKYFALPFFIVGLFILEELAFNFRVIGHFSGIAHEKWELNKHISSFVLLSPLPVSFLIARGRMGLAAAMLVLVCAILHWSDNQASTLAIVVAALALVFHRLAPKAMLCLCFGAALCAVVTVPFTAPVAYDLVADRVGDDGFLRHAAAAQRLEIWDRMAAHVMERPLLGHGIDAAKSIPFDDTMIYFREKSVLHPHNFAVQLWIEFGLAGAVLAGAAIALIYRRIKALDRPAQRLPIALFCLSFVILLASWSLWASWFMGLMLVIAAFGKFACRPTGGNASPAP